MEGYSFDVLTYWLGANYRPDVRMVADAMRVYDRPRLEHLAPGWAAEMKRHHQPGYWRELILQLQSMLAAEPVNTETGLACIPGPTLPRPSGAFARVEPRLGRSGC